MEYLHNAFKRLVLFHLFPFFRACNLYALIFLGGIGMRKIRTIPL